MDDESLKNSPKFKNVEAQIDLFILLKRTLPYAKPLLQKLNIDAGGLEKALDGVEDLKRELDRLVELLDRFNEHFSKRGWIAYEMQKTEVMKAAVEMADAGNIDDAEQVLVDYYSPQTIRQQLFFMKSIKAFQPRIRLVNLALDDYEAGRYHACVPVVLALMDGLVNELNNNRGFFAKDTELEAWESISAYRKGLNELGRIFGKMRQQTVTEEITVPYRNGIMHGMDLGYDNKMVAAKTWAGLLALKDWAQKAEKNALHKPADKPKPTLIEFLGDKKRQDAELEIIKTWKPRSILVGIDAPRTGEPEAYLEGTPERKLAEFFLLWKKKNFGYMAKCASPANDKRSNTSPKNLREVYGTKELIEFEMIKISDKAIAATEIEVRIVFKEGDKEYSKNHTFRLFYFDENAKAGARGIPDHQWYVYNWRSIG